MPNNSFKGTATSSTFLSKHPGGCPLTPALGQVKYLEQPPGASKYSVDKIQSAYSATIPDDLRSFWQASDGPTLWFGFKELQFFATAEVVEDIYQLKTYLPGAIPLCLDGNSNICVARVEVSQIVGYYVAACSDLEWDTSKQIAATFTDFLQDSASPESRLQS
jgi:hypothetical protein